MGLAIPSHMRSPLHALLVVFLSTGCASSEDVESGQANGNQQGGGTCVGACGKEAADQSCWCDDTCAENGDCCADLSTACSAFPSNTTTGGTGGTGGLSNTGGGGSGALGGSSFGGASNTGGAPGSASCAGYCGSSAPGEACWCDPECVTAGNCCPDYAAVCGGGGQPATGGCTPTLCNTDSPAVENGVDCYCNAACFEYADCCSNAQAVCGL